MCPEGELLAVINQENTHIVDALNDAIQKRNDALYFEITKIKIILVD